MPVVENALLGGHPQLRDVRVETGVHHVMPQSVFMYSSLTYRQALLRAVVCTQLSNAHSALTDCSFARSLL
jgi:hypothetical protein